MKKLDVEVVEEHLEEYEEPRYKKYLIMIIALFLIFLMVSFVIASPTIQNIIVSLFESTTIQNGLVEQDVTVKFEDDTYDQLVNLYYQNEDKEFKACLKGRQDDTYIITEVFVPETYSQTYNQVIAEKCPEDTLIALHSHPYRHCIASRQDLKNLEQAKEVNPKALIGIMCEPGRFNFYA